LIQIDLLRLIYHKKGFRPDSEVCNPLICGLVQSLHLQTQA
jgi:hypothetical protein